MEIASNAEQESTGERRIGKFWYFLASGSVGGGAIIAFAFLPPSLTGFVSLITIGLWSLTGLLRRRFVDVPLSPVPRQGVATVVYAVVFSLVLGSALVLDFFVVRRGDLPWLAWVLVGVVIAVGGNAAWLADVHSTPDTASPT